MCYSLRISVQMKSGQFHHLGENGSLIFLVISLVIVRVISSKSCVCSTKVNWIVPENYDKNEAPYESENEPTEVFVNIDIMDIDQITEEKMEYSMQFYVNEYWKDPRLNLSHRKEHFHIPTDIVADMWTPDLIFENSKGGWVYQLAVPNIVVQVHLYGYLHRFTRYNMKISCSMHLQSYPMDKQNCFLSIASLANDDSRMILKWIHERKKEERVDELSDLYLAKFHPLKYQVVNVTTDKAQFEWPIGVYTSLRANFTFDRHLSSHIFNVYIPSGLVVLLSFLSFWLNVRSVPARVALGLTSLLTLSTQASQVRSRLPPINYLTALDVWLFVCILLVFLSLIEYATVYSSYSVKVRNQRSSPSKAWSATGTRRNIASELSMIGTETRTAKKKREISSPKQPLGADFDEEVQTMDKASRFIFPLGFLIFSIAYWASYLRRS